MLRRPAVLLLLAIAAVFWPVLAGSYVYDDHILVLRNQALLHGDLGALLGAPLFGTDHGYWRPLTSLLLWLGHTLGGAAGIHTLALLLHTTATLVAFGLAERLFGERQPAFWAALLFALHPVQVESVAWCAAINDPVWGLLALLAVRRAIAWRDAGGAGVPWTAAACCFGALLAKENALVVLPLVGVAVTVAPALQIPALPASRTLPLAALPRWGRLLLGGTAVVLAWWLLRAWVFGELGAGFLRGPAQPPIDAERLASAPAELLLRHTLLLAVPFPLTPFRSFAEQISVWQAMLWIGGTAALGLGLGRVWRLLSATTKLGLAFVLLPIVPVLVRFRAAGAYPIADRYLYLAAFGTALVVVDWSRQFPRRRWLPWLLALLWAPLSFVQTWVWHDARHFAEHALRWAPEDPNVWVQAGDFALERARQGDAQALASARSAYEFAARLAPATQGTGSDPSSHRALAGAQLGLAWCLALEQNLRRGPGTKLMLEAFQLAVTTDPTRADAWVGLGVGNGIAERYTEAERALRKALDLDPDHGTAWSNLGNLQRLTNRPTEARTSLQQALRCNPQDHLARQLLDQLR